MADANARLIAFVVAACAATSVEVHGIGAADSVFAGADDVVFDGDPCLPSPHLTASIVREGEVVARVTVRPRLTVTVPGWLSAEDVGVGEAVTAIAGPVALSADPPVSYEGPWRARSALKAGAPLTRTRVVAAPDAPRGARVNIVVHRGSVALTAPGRLLQDGLVGQPVRVHNAATNTPLTGVLADATTVEIR